MAKEGKKSAAKGSAKDKKPAKAVSKSAVPSTATPPPQLMDLVENFLSENDFSDAHREFKKQRAQKGWKKLKAASSGAKDHHSLVTVFQTWETSLNKPEGEAPKLKVEDVTSVSSSESSDDSDDEDVDMKDAPKEDVERSESSSSSSSSSDSSSDSDSDSSDDEAQATVNAVVTKPNPLKRKAETDSESSSSDSSSESESDSDSSDSSSDSSSEDEKPQTKRQKKAPVQSSSSESSSDSSSEESSTEESSSEDSSSDSDSEVKVAAQIPLPGSPSSSSSDSDSSSDSSDSESDEPETKTEANGVSTRPVKSEPKTTKSDSSDTSVTLGKTSPEVFPVSTFAPLPPDPATYKANNRGGKKNGHEINQPNVPFSRIKDDVKVDPKFASNAFAGHEWGQKAHEDLIVTRGKGFTKEKNKKKKGSYQGGRIDTHARGGIKFE